jgi:hypothetical protein
VQAAALGWHFFLLNLFTKRKNKIKMEKMNSRRRKIWGGRKNSLQTHFTNTLISNAHIYIILHTNTISLSHSHTHTFLPRQTPTQRMLILLLMLFLLLLLFTCMFNGNFFGSTESLALILRYIIIFLYTSSMC